MEIVKQSNQSLSFNYFDSEQFATMQRLCQMFSASDLVPDKYRTSEKNPAAKAIANCMIAVETAQRINASPLMVMQNLDVIQGKPSWSSKFLISTINTCGKYEQLKYRFQNLGKVGKLELTETKWEGGQKKIFKVVFDGSDIDNIECVAYTTLKGSDEVIESSEVTIKMAIIEGWYTKAGSKWPIMTKKMLRYRAASFWTNEHAPELSLGMRTVEENQDIEDIDYEEISDKVATKIKENANKQEMTMEATPPPQVSSDPAPAQQNNSNTPATEQNPI
ncbi:hypothetical protein [Chitinophaga sancti]|uniref:Uncharacterized protein n=1 Tax=Chitinophaga sancti TaxID=1004 RepID=A0A1K1M0G3_9BACT|nr:hypothetical protein [Chitinophaga sancti]WQD64718.1 hypothetical protein U0033_09955 [Chitinophaga sancti]WQG89660.1 hypothetical protein SR876_32520 [Chitinophaga sancti]SFW16636.1 hypothetical protein SAMN05661012_00351 [Chitinophaga sancti]